MIEAGKILQNRYRIEKQIGQGGMGTVFVGVDERFGSMVAIKKTIFDDPKLSKAFEREARLLNSLKHPALPKVSDHFIEDDGQFIVMEFISGDDLSETLEKRDKPFSVGDVLDWADQLCDALTYLHSQDMPVIHRDIKPQNLKLTPSGQIVLLDFGLAKGDANDSSHKTAAKSIFGYSRNYASLEQMQGTGTDPQSDLYALGATLYHLLTGIPPADALTRAMNVVNAKSDPLIPANFLNDQIPESVSDVLSRAMALNATERPSSALEMHDLFSACDLSVETHGNGHVASPLSTEIFTQRTKLMTQDTNLETAAVSQISKDRKTSENSETATQVSGAGPALRSTVSRRKTLYAGSALSLVLVIGGFAVYYGDSGVVDSEALKPNEMKIDQPQPVDQVLVASNSNSTNSTDDNSNSELSAKQPEEAKADSAAVPAETQIAEKSKKKAETSVSGVNVPADKFPDGTFDFEMGDIPSIGERVETEDFVIDRNGITIKNPAKFPGFGGLPLNPERLERMSPRQKQKLSEMLMNQKRLKELQNSTPIPPKSPPANTKVN